MKNIDTSIKVNTDELKTMLYTYVSLDLPVMVWGPPGIGKSAVVFELGNQLNRPVLDIRLGYMDPTDMKGIPYYDAETKSLKWAPTSELPREGQGLDNAILFLDEINGSTPSVQGTAYQLIHNRRIGEYHLPKNVRIIAAGNNDTDRGVTYKMPKPLANRFSHLQVKPDFDVFQKVAMKLKFHPDVIGHLSNAKAESFDFDPKSESKAFPTYRSWEVVSKLMYGRDDGQVNSSLLLNFVSAAVGDSAAHSFMTHLNVSAKIPTAEEVLTGKVTEFSNDADVSAHFTMVVRMCTEMSLIYEKLKDPKIKEVNQSVWKLANLCFYRFITNNLSPEMAIMAAQTIVRDYDLPFCFEADGIDEFVEKYGKYIQIN